MHWFYLTGIVLLIGIVILFLWDVFQKEHSILRTYPIIGYLRYFAEYLGVFLRQFFYARDREELPFDRAERSWVYEAAKNKDPIIGFGSTRDRKPLGRIYYVDAPFPVLERKKMEPHAVTIGKESCRHPYTSRALVNISGMSYGSISKNAVLALSGGAKLAGCWLNTGEGGLTSYHLSSGCDVVAQIGSAKYGFRDKNGNLSDELLKKAAAYEQVKMFEIKLSQGAKPGMGGELPAAKVTREIAEFRDIPPYEDAISPNRFPEIANSSELLDFICHVREVTGKPTGFKVVLGDYTWLHELFEEIIRRGSKCAPDFITIDGAEGGSGAAPMSLADYMGLPLAQSLPVLVDTLTEYGLRERIKVIASGKLITAGKVVWAFCMGADFVATARGAMFSLGCIQALRCHENTCPTGIATHKTWLKRGLDPRNKTQRVYHYLKNLEKDIGLICHSCGVEDPRELKRSHARIVSVNGTSVSLADVYPDKKSGCKLKDKK